MWADGYVVCTGGVRAAACSSRLNSYDGRVSMERDRGNDPRDESREVVGIVVSRGVEEQRRPRAVAFVWGGKVRPAPSLPYGRWKNGVRPAA